MKQCSNVINIESKKSQAQLESDTDAESWQTLAEVTLVSILSFNQRLAGETERSLLHEYNKRSTDNLSVKDIADSGPILSVFFVLIVHSELKCVHPGFPVAFIF